MPEYINVIIPLKLDWEPFYRLGSGEKVCVGDRVGVPFAGRAYVGVVSAVDVQLPPSVKASSVKEIYSVKEDLRRISLHEIAFWRSLAEYYMCSVGEVFKAAYPPVRESTLSLSGRRRTKEYAYVPEGEYPPLDAAGAGMLNSLKEGLKSGKPVVLASGDAVPVLLNLCRETSGNVLWMVPESDMEKGLGEQLTAVLGSRLLLWKSNATPSQRRRMLETLAQGRGDDGGGCPCGKGYVLLGTRSSLLLPHNKLSLIIVGEEQDTSYKQTSSAPRYNGRDAAVLLARVTGAGLVMTSATPSLDTEYNCLSGKYLSVPASSGSLAPDVEFDIVDTRAEMRKNGMVGDIPRRLVTAVKESGTRLLAYKPRRAAFPKLEELEPQLRSLLGDDFCLTDEHYAGDLRSANPAVMAIFGMDALFGRSDFRADERALQTVRQAVASALAGAAKGAVPGVAPGAVPGAGNVAGTGAGAGQCDDDAAGNGGKRPGRGKRSLKVVIPVKVASHPVFTAVKSGDVTPMLQERKEFSLPPFTRLVDVAIHDSFPDRCAAMTAELAEKIRNAGICSVLPAPGGLRLTFARDRFLLSRKETLRSIISEFERTRKYSSHISLDVDPQ